MVAADGGIFAFGSAPFLGSWGGKPISAPMVGMTPVYAPLDVNGAMAPTPDNKGYLLVDIGGDVGLYGDAPLKGTPQGTYNADPIVGAAITADNGGYWMVGAGGELYTYGDAVNYGTLSGSNLIGAVVGLITTSDGKGYWEFTDEGQVQNYGDATNLGDVTAFGSRPNVPILAMAVTPNNKGYTLLAADGGLFDFGDAVFNGSPSTLSSTGINPSSNPTDGIAFTADGGGYWIVDQSGTVFPFGDATRYTGPKAATYIQGMVATNDHKGYWLFGYYGGEDITPYGDAADYPYVGSS
jgi:hypothetical protein